MTTALTETYAEEMGEQAFDWNRALDLAIARQPVDPKTWVGMQYRSASWITCACGNQCAAIPRDISGAPIDLLLRVLGANFALQVGEEDWLGAKATLLAIESRAKELLSEL